jgi:tetratricopeptide (TPR) repeat protein
MRSGRNGMNSKKQYCVGLLGLALLILVMVEPGSAQIRVESDKQKPTLAPVVDKPNSTVTNPVVAVSDSSTAPLPEDSGSIEPIPDTADAANQTDVPKGPVKLEVASFNGVTPGETTAEELEAKWGKSKAEKTIDQNKVYHYSLGPFPRLEVSVDLASQKVVSIVIRLDKPFPSKDMAAQLQLSRIRPVLVSNSNGEILGQSFPERGVLFAFEKNYKLNQPSMMVTEVVLESLGADPFVLRAETNLGGDPLVNLEDLKHANQIDPKHSRAYWLKARILASLDRMTDALTANQQAVELDGGNCSFRLTFAQILQQSGQYEKAAEQAKEAVRLSEKRPLVQASSLSLLGDLAEGGSMPDFAKALKLHTLAIKTAIPLTTSTKEAIRQAAFRLLVESHLGAASDIAWGDWSQKEKSVAEWISRARGYAEQIEQGKNGSDEALFQVASRALAIYVGLGGKVDPTEMAEETWTIGSKLIGQAEGNKEKTRLRLETGLALFNAVQIYQVRRDHNLALDYGQKTAQMIEASRNPNRADPEQEALLGRLYFRLGAVHALTDNNHREAIAWYDKSLKRFEAAVANSDPEAMSHRGDSFVSMGVSYWEMDQKEKAIELTKRGLAMIQQAVESGGVDSKAILVPCENLAVMEAAIGNKSEAERYEILASEVKSGRKPAVMTAERPGAASKR